MSEPFNITKTLLNWRYAVRRFSNKKAPLYKINTLLSMTGLSASSYGLQPYKILVIENVDVKSELLSYSYGQTKVRDNSHLLVLTADMSSTSRMIDNYITKLIRGTQLSVAKGAKMRESMLAGVGGMSTDEQYQWASEQVSIAMGTLLLSAASLGIDSCPMGGFDKTGFDSVLKLHQQELKTVLICPIGYRHEADLQLPKIRKSLTEFVKVVS